MPTEKKKPDTDPAHRVGLLLGREKVGKSTALASFPDGLFLTTEPGTKGLDIYEYNAENGGCKTWELVRAAAKLLEKTKRFKTVIIDTGDRAYDLCLDWVCKQRGIDYPGADEYGREDYGKSWKAVAQEFVGVIHRIIQTGRGVWFTSHARETAIKSQSGTSFTRIGPTLSGQARRVIEPLADMILYAEYMRAEGGGTRRVVITQGDELVTAGVRKIGGGLPDLPRLIPLTEEGWYEILRDAFRGKDVGLDPKTLLPSRAASEAVRTFFRATRSRKEEKSRKRAPRRRVSRREA